MLLIGAISTLAALSLQPNTEMLRRIFEEGLARRQEQYGTFDARTAQAARDLGLFLGQQGETAAGRNILDQVVRIDSKVFGPTAPQTLADVAELAALSPEAQAEPLWRRAADSTEPATSARALAELGKSHALSGDRSGAADFYRRALANEETATGKNSAAVALDLNALAKVVEPAEAIPLVERALAINRRVLGSQHAETATTEANLAGLLADTPRNSEAIRLATEALGVFRQTVGENHPRTALTASILGYAFEVKGDRRRAERMYRLALAIDESVLGPRNRQTLNDAQVLREFLQPAPKEQH